ncbi:MAG TPA: VOC family protein [Candidatus Limnocylindria bacterium]|nr:VOC family protein [Candidatus Limnocylindria bacterium]
MATLTPMLTVRNAADAIDFYGRALGAREVGPRSTSPSGQIVAELELEGQRFFVVDENVSAQNLSPETLRGTTVRFSLIVDDPDAVARRAVNAGASVVFPVEDQPYGMRQGRVADPFGHHWLIGRRSAG